MLRLTFLPRRGCVLGRSPHSILHRIETLLEGVEYGSRPEHVLSGPNQLDTVVTCWLAPSPGNPRRSAQDALTAEKRLTQCALLIQGKTSVACMLAASFLNRIFIGIWGAA